MRADSRLTLTVRLDPAIIYCFSRNLTRWLAALAVRCLPSYGQTELTARVSMHVIAVKLTGIEWI